MPQPTTAAKTTRLAFRGLVLSKGYTCAELAEEIRMPPSQLSDRARGRTPWRWAEAVAVCRVLGITLDEFARYYPG